MIKDFCRKICRYGIFAFAAVAGIMIMAFRVYADDAAALTPEYTCSNGASVYDMTDDSYYSMSSFNNGDTITISSDTPMTSLYIAWNNKTVSPWTLTLEDGTTQSCGESGFLHEYVELDAPSRNVIINIQADGMNICKLFVFGEGDKPQWVQDWDNPCSSADILLISTHADDEQLFFGGIIPYYAGELELQVQVAYYTNYWNGANVREHEKLDGLWTVGVKNYPVNGDFDDIYATSLESAMEVYSYNDTVGFMTELIRRFKPLVVVGQDLNGEYGHGGHMITAAAICDAVEISNDPNSYPDSASLYGVYDVPKTYLHLYPENQIDLDCRRPLTNFDGKTVLEVAAEGYLQHQSQQWCWFYVSDDYEYSCGRFGLYRTTVGLDTTADILENLVTYEEQARIAAEEESSREAESMSIAESERASIEESVSASNAASQQDEISRQESKKNSLKTVLIVMIVLLVVLAAVLIVTIMLRRKRSDMVRRRRRR